MLDQDDKCFSCQRAFRKAQPRQRIMVCDEDTSVFVGPDCYKKIAAAGTAGYQNVGPALRVMTPLERLSKGDTA